MSNREIPGIEDYRAKVERCFLGKIIGGGIGAPYEGCPYPSDLTPSDVMIDMGPNDDLELQLVWLLWAEEHRLSLTSEHLAEAWASTIKYGLDEYGVARRNLGRGIRPPYSGAVDNYFVDGMGAAIRSEIWACLFPGRPDVAGHFAGQDAAVDHWGNGVWGEIFLARLESEAFVERDLGRLIAGALEAIPPSSRVHHVVDFVLTLHADDTPPEQLRPMILDRFGSHNFTDVVMNLGFIIAALLYGGDDFTQTILAAVNFGMDTDCTAATCGAIFALTHDLDEIPQEYTQALSTEIAVSEFLEETSIPRGVDVLVDRVVSLGSELAAELEDGRRCFPGYQPCVVPEDMNPIHNEWLVVRTENPPELKAIEDALRSGEPVKENDRIIRLSTGDLYLDLSEYCDSTEPIFLYTKLVADRDYSGQLMVCANTGLTVWLDDARIMNYHGRLKQVPAFHRTEGGSVVPVSLRGKHEHMLKIKLYFCTRDINATIAFADEDNMVIDIGYRT